jgi:polyisoprenoid-binding protein YceI
MNRKTTWLLGNIGRRSALSAVALSALFGAGCDDKSTPTNIAPTSTALAEGKPAAAGAQKFTVDKTSSKVDFVMEAPQEKIRGRVHGASQGDLQVNLEDITKTTGLITVDISGIEVYQTKADDSGKFGEETKSDLQNKHVRTWLEISDDAPEDARAKNSKVQFSIKSIEAAGEKNVLKMAGAERKVTFTAKGDFLLHQHKADKAVELQATFKFEGDKPVSVAVKTAKPFSVDLAEYEVKPRDAFGKFALKSLEALAPKVAKEAQVSLDFTAKLDAAGGTQPAKAP